MSEKEKHRKVKLNVLVPFFSFEMNVDPNRSLMSFRFRLWSFFFLSRFRKLKKKEKKSAREEKKKKTAFCVGKIRGSCEWDQISREKKKAFRVETVTRKEENICLFNFRIVHNLHHITSSAVDTHNFIKVSTNESLATSGKRLAEQLARIELDYITDSANIVAENKVILIVFFWSSSGLIGALFRCVTYKELHNHMLLISGVCVR